MRYTGWDRALATLIATCNRRIMCSGGSIWSRQVAFEIARLSDEHQLQLFHARHLSDPNDIIWKLERRGVHWALNEGLSQWAAI